MNLNKFKKRIQEISEVVIESSMDIAEESIHKTFAHVDTHPLTVKYHPITNERLKNLSEVNIIRDGTTIKISSEDDQLIRIQEVFGAKPLHLAKQNMVKDIRSNMVKKIKNANI